VLSIARGLPRRETFALDRRKSWARAIGLVLGVLAATYVLIALVSSAIGPGGKPDQGIPAFWDGSRAAQFALAFVVAGLALGSVRMRTGSVSPRTGLVSAPPRVSPRNATMSAAACPRARG
jgi:hypothetical protein